ncbi:hypothetical protein [uncultured Clostridium sp.]|uniref:hypothetical protein n=1 Tax=uncultured Clostridium sp. TaxID=59620 RepID=UPI00261340CD|nr:hypothetical protein [uncultured Clostridium sp.]
MLKICLNCNKEFEGTSKQKCCSRKCSNELLHPPIIVKCDICGKEIKRNKSQIGKSKHFYCSKECRAIGIGKFQCGENNPNYKGANTIVKCSNCNKEFRVLNCNLRNSDGSLKKNIYCSKKCKAEHQKEILKGKNNPKYRGGKIEIQCSFCEKTKFVDRNRYTNSKYHYCSQECKAKHQEITMLGENNPNYINGLSEDYRERYRIIDRYNIWRREVYERDNCTCQCCGDSKGGNLNAHHLNSYNSNKELILIME